MKLLHKYFIGLVFSTFSFIACEDMVETEILHPADLQTNIKDEAYYQRLKAYKASDHQVSFGWFGGWKAPTASYENSLQGLPDSIDFVSLWGNWKNPSPEMIEDLRCVQKKKNTRALVCFLVFDIGDQITPAMPQEEIDKGTTFTQWRHKFWGWDAFDKEKQLIAVEKYANAICDTIDKYNYDGFDLDAEPTIRQPFKTDKELWDYGRSGRDVMVKFVETMSKRIGPKSGTGRLFVVDGQPEQLPANLLGHFDYIILQTYSTYYAQDNSKLDERFSTQYEHFKEVASAEEIARKLIICEDFESFAKNGGAPFKQPDGNVIKSLSGFAYWNPTINGVQYRKGGVGTFHMEYENNPGKPNTYPALRQAIQIQNPSKK